MIQFEKEKYVSRRMLVAGDVITFSYKGKPRVGVVITPNWYDKCDCYEFSRLETIPDDMLFMITSPTGMNDGELFEYYGNGYDFKSFHLDQMVALQKIELKLEMESTEAPSSPVIEQAIDVLTGRGLYGE